MFNVGLSRVAFVLSAVKVNGMLLSRFPETSEGPGFQDNEEVVLSGSGKKQTPATVVVLEQFSLHQIGMSSGARGRPLTPYVSR